MRGMSRAPSRTEARVARSAEVCCAPCRCPREDPPRKSPPRGPPEPLPPINRGRRRQNVAIIYGMMCRNSPENSSIFRFAGSFYRFREPKLIQKYTISKLFGRNWSMQFAKGKIQLVRFRSDVFSPKVSSFHTYLPTSIPNHSNRTKHRCCVKIGGFDYYYVLLCVTMYYCVFRCTYVLLCTTRYVLLCTTIIRIPMPSHLFLRVFWGEGMVLCRLFQIINSIIKKWIRKTKKNSWNVLYSPFFYLPLIHLVYYWLYVVETQIRGQTFVVG